MLGELKVCSRKEACLVGNPLQPKENFSGRKQSPDGKSYTCKTCERATATKSYKRRKAAAASKKRYQANRENNIERSKAYYLANKDTILGQQAIYRQERPEVWKKSGAVRRTRLRSANGGSAPYTRSEIIARDSGLDGVPICQICFTPVHLQEELQLDHVVPVAMGGANTAKNVRVAHKACNAARPKDGRDI